MKKLILLAALATLSTATLAADQSWYAGVDVGSTQFKADGGSDRKTGFGATLGYHVSPNLAFELQGHRLGKWNEDGANATASAWSLSGVLGGKVYDPISLYVRFGATRNALHASINGSGSGSVHRFKPVMGVGAEVAVGGNVSLRAEYANLGVNDVGNTSVKIQQFNLGLNYGF